MFKLQTSGIYFKDGGHSGHDVFYNTIYTMDLHIKFAEDISNDFPRNEWKLLLY